MRDGCARSQIWILPFVLGTGFFCFLATYLPIQISMMTNIYDGWLYAVSAVVILIAWLFMIYWIARLVKWSEHQIDKGTRKEKRKRS